MITFDEILPLLEKIFQQHQDNIASIKPVLVNRDLNGRVRLIVDEKLLENVSATKTLVSIAQELEKELGAHAFPVQQAILYESDLISSIHLDSTLQIEGIDDVYVKDRLATEGDWSTISPQSTVVPRVVFFSIKGGVGRSTALAATAWALAESGKRVLVLDLDLESPGLSSSLLPEDRRPTYGIVDWLVEDLVNNESAVFENMVATSELSHNGEILVVPAHGAKAGEYIAKLGRVWMPKVGKDGIQESWTRRLSRMLRQLESRWSPDVVLIDSRSGIDEISSACLTDLSATTILLFAIDGDQTWSGYNILFRHWRMSGVVRQIRERLQVVGAMVPEIGSEEYLEELLERAWDSFSEELYDEVPAGAIASEDEVWSFDQADVSAPHYPWPIRWNRGFAALKSLFGRLSEVDSDEVQTIFGHLVNGLSPSIESKRDVI
jgi:hypothetical protein